MKKIVALILALALCFALGACGAKTADPTPTESAAPAEAEASAVWQNGETVTCIVPSRAGGGTDLIARYVTQALQENLNANFVVNNYDTAEVGYLEAANAKGDGLTITTASCSNPIQYFSGASEVDARETLKIVGQTHNGSLQAWIAHPDAPYNNMEELAEYIKAHPGEVTVGCSLGGTAHMIWIDAMEALGCADLVTYVQCSSNADKLTNVAAGSIALGNADLKNSYAYEQDGKIKVIGTVGPKSDNLETAEMFVGAELHDGWKTMIEQGYDNSWESGYYFAVPASTDEATCQAIGKILMDLNNDEEFKANILSMGSVPQAFTIEEARANFAAECEMCEKLLTDLGLNVRN